MHVDAIIAIAIFILITTWSFTYYYGLFDGRENLQQYAVETVGSKIMGKISTDAYKIPVHFSSSANLTNHVFYFDYIWKNGTGNSSRVLDESGTPLACELFNDAIYWETDIESGNDYIFDVKYTASDLPLNCTETTYHLAANMSKVIPRAEEKKLMISQYLIDEMSSTSYYQFKSEQGIAEDFYIEIVTSSGTTTYGIPIPQSRNVYSVSFKRVIWESGLVADVMINLW